MLGLKADGSSFQSSSVYVSFFFFLFMFGQMKSEQGWREPHYGPDMEEKVAVLN